MRGRTEESETPCMRDRRARSALRGRGSLTQGRGLLHIPNGPGTKSRDRWLETGCGRSPGTRTTGFDPKRCLPRPRIRLLEAVSSRMRGLFTSLPPMQALAVILESQCVETTMAPEPPVATNALPVKRTALKLAWLSSALGVQVTASSLTSTVPPVPTATY